MNDQVVWYLGNNLLLDCVAPLDYGANPAAPIVMDAATTKQGHLFSKNVKSVTSKSEASAATTVTLESVTGLTNSDTITIEETDGTWSRHPVTGVDAATKIVTFTTGLTDGAAVGARVWKTYGTAVVEATAYGTAGVASTTWGYAIDFTYDYDTAIRRDEKLEAMAVLHKASTGGHWTKIWDVIVAEPYGTP